jgi:microcystin-dependent protein
MDNYIGEIRPFAFGFVPTGWHICDGTLLPLQQYQALYALIGTSYGGDGRTNFAIPDLRGRCIVGVNNANVNITVRTNKKREKFQ